MRRTVQAYVLRLPISYFDSTKSGILISRIMTDAEGIRNLVGTGLVQLAGGLITAAIALGVLFYLNWRLTLIAILILGGFGGGMAYARSEEHTSELQSQSNLVCRLLLEKKKNKEDSLDVIITSNNIVI